MPVLKIKNNGVWEQVGGIPDHTHVIDDITDFPDSLPADGGNADTVDGKHASDFISAPIDVSEAYDAWTPEDDDKTVAAFANTLDVGLYYCCTRLSTVYVGEHWFNVYSHTLRGVTNKYVFIRSISNVGAQEEVYCNGTLMSSIYTDGTMQLGDQQVVTATTVPTVSDAGKILMVSENGKAVWASVVNTEEVAV